MDYAMIYIKLKADATIPTLAICRGIVRKETPRYNLTRLESVVTYPEVLYYLVIGVKCLLSNYESVYGCQLSLIKGCFSSSAIPNYF